MFKRFILPGTALLLLFACTQAFERIPFPIGLRPAAPVPVPPLPTSDTAAAPIEIIRDASILVLGDSQISFGAGGAYTAFFDNLGEKCPESQMYMEGSRAAAIGVRSTALHHWTARNEPARGMICDVDEKFGVNAGAYGVTSAGRTYVQIGADPEYPFCRGGRSPLEAVFEAPNYDPDLVVLTFLGNATDRWQSARNAATDWEAAAAQLPPAMPCIAMTTIPSYLSDENDRRARAQDNLSDAIAASGRCTFVAGFTPQTRAAIEGNPDYFRQDEDGTVIDPRHPTAQSAAHFIDMMTPALCAAVTQALPN